jgi:hypothetical protein
VVVEFVGDRPSFAFGEGAANADLVGNRGVTLVIRRVPSAAYVLFGGLVERRFGRVRLFVAALDALEKAELRSAYMA